MHVNHVGLTKASFCGLQYLRLLIRAQSCKLTDIKADPVSLIKASYYGLQQLHSVFFQRSATAIFEFRGTKLLPPQAYQENVCYAVLAMPCDLLSLTCTLSLCQFSSVLCVFCSHVCPRTRTRTMHAHALARIRENVSMNMQTSKMIAHKLGYGDASARMQFRTNRSTPP